MQAMSEEEALAMQAKLEKDGEAPLTICTTNQVRDEFKNKVVSNGQSHFGKHKTLKVSHLTLIESGFWGLVG